MQRALRFGCGRYDRRPSRGGAAGELYAKGTYGLPEVFWGIAWTAGCGGGGGGGGAAAAF